MIPNLIVMNSSYCGSRDLWWVDDPASTKGYNLYRAFDYPTNWVKLNAHPWLGHFYRDQVCLEEVTYVVQEKDWRDDGRLGKWGFKLPEPIYSDVVTGRPTIANSPDDVQVFLDGVPMRPVMVVGIDQTVWLQRDNTLPYGGGVSAQAQAYTDNINITDYSGVKEIKVIYKRLANYVDIYTSMVRTFYCVVPIGDHGETHPPGAPGTKVVNTMEVDQLTWEYREMINRNQWLFEQVGEPAYILFRKTRGEICACRGSESGLGQPRTGCPSCFEVGFVGGYYGPYDITYVPPDSALTRELDEGGGIKSTRESRGYLGPTPITQDGDLIVRRNGERLVVSGVTYKAPRGILLQQDFNTNLLNPGDTRYLIPLNTGLPTVYDPIIRNPLQGGEPGAQTGNGEPVWDARLQPGKVWENEVEIPIGRSVVFGKIQR